jgi:hypothetical protein
MKLALVEFAVKAMDPILIRTVSSPAKFHYSAADGNGPPSRPILAGRDIPIAIGEAALLTKNETVI